MNASNNFPKRLRKQTRKAKGRSQGNLSTHERQLEVTGLPRPSGGELVIPRYNPSWNPQYLKVAREFQYSAPAADFGGGFGIVSDPSVGCSTTLLSYSSGAYSFRVSDVYNVSEFGNLFDQYRIAAVRLTFTYISSAETVLVTTAASMQQCTLLLYEDYDDSTAPAATNTGWQTITESGRQVRKVFPNKENSLSYVIRPRYLAVAVDNSAGTTGRQTTDEWLDGATSPDVVWRGLKWAIQANPAPVTVGHYFRVTAKYYLCFRNRQ